MNNMQMAFSLVATIIAPFIWSFLIHPFLMSKVSYSYSQTFSTWVGMPLFVGLSVYIIILFNKEKKDQGADV
jgi:anaerobic C4-dicarboxylate transporter